MTNSLGVASIDSITMEQIKTELVKDRLMWLATAIEKLVPGRPTLWRKSWEE